MCLRTVQTLDCVSEHRVSSRPHDSTKTTLDPPLRFLRDGRHPPVALTLDQKTQLIMTLASAAFTPDPHLICACDSGRCTPPSLAKGHCPHDRACREQMQCARMRMQPPLPSHTHTHMHTLLVGSWSPTTPLHRSGAKTTVQRPVGHMRQYIHWRTDTKRIQSFA